MSIRRNSLRAAALAALVAWPLAAQDKMAAKKPLEASDTQSITATVEAVDSANRELTLKGPKGNVVVVEVPDAVKRFSEIKVGDQLNVKYTESLIVALRKAEATAKLGTSTDTGVTRMEGPKPAAVVSRQITATVEVASVDKAANAVTVRRADGSTVAFRAEDPKNLEGLNPGDKIVVTYKEALALQVTSPAAPKK
jgi:Cu/Ag efflux protein CusF